MTSQLRPALVILVAMTILTGVVYPAMMLGVGRSIFPRQAGGSLIGVIDPTATQAMAIGSDLIGQSFTRPEYFWGRPSATSPTPYNAASSSGSNLGPTNPALVDAVRARVAALRAADPGNRQPIPVDLVTASGSGLDPHISPAAARYQASRVARVRGVSQASVDALVEEYTKGRQFGFLGEPRVNVLHLNMALDAPRLPQKRSGTVKR